LISVKYIHQLIRKHAFMDESMNRFQTMDPRFIPNVWAKARTRLNAGDDACLRINEFLCVAAGTIKTIHPLIQVK
jgi:hypothetical protein